MPATRGKQHFSNAVQFDGLDSFQFAPLTLGAGFLNGATRGIWVLPTVVKIYRVVAYIAPTPVPGGTCAINLVAGAAAESAAPFASMPIPDTEYANQPVPPGAVAYPPAYATPGQKLFLTDAPIVIAPDTPTILTPSDSAITGAYAPNTPGNAWDALWGPGGSTITLRVATNAGGAGSLSVAVLFKLYDPAGSSSKPTLASFNPATDIP